MFHVRLDIHTEHIALSMFSQTGQVVQGARVRGIDQMPRILKGLPDRFDVNCLV
jgi:hypothetical protein